MPIDQVNITRNQSTLKVTLEHVFLFDNRFDERVLHNTTATAEITIKAGDLLFKNAATTVDKLTDVDANIDKIVGIAAMESDVAVADTATLNINMGVEGTINENLINLPGTMTFDDVIPTTNLTLRDHLNQLGFHLETSSENTKFDNL